MAQKISQMTEQTTASMTEAGTSDFLGGYTATDGNANRKFSLSGLANYFLNKFKMTLGGSSQTVKSAIDALNSKNAIVTNRFRVEPNTTKTLTGYVDYGTFLVSAQVTGLGGYAEIINTTATAITKRTVFSANDPAFQSAITYTKQTGTLAITNNYSGTASIMICRLDYYDINID